jgi:hemerythrin-like domain-containing protein
MAMALSPMLQTACKKIRVEHRELMDQLGQFERALNPIEWYSELSPELNGIERIKYFGNRLLSQLLDHFHREEKMVLAGVAQIGPELAEFSRKMHLEHEAMRGRLAALSHALEQLEDADNMCDALFQIKEQGRALARQLATHVAREESELEQWL